jgi:hypothetical protein
MISCQEKSTEMQIFHIDKDDIYPNQVIVDGQIIVQGEHKEAFFAIKNFDFHDEKQMEKLNSLIKVSLKNIPYKDYQLFTINFYQYGDDITEKTRRSHGTDWENETFNIQKLIAVYTWEKDAFLSAQFYENGDLLKGVGGNSGSFFFQKRQVKSHQQMPKN